MSNASQACQSLSSRDSGSSEMCSGRLGAHARKALRAVCVGLCHAMRRSSLWRLVPNCLLPHPHHTRSLFLPPALVVSTCVCSVSRILVLPSSLSERPVIHHFPFTFSLALFSFSPSHHRPHHVSRISCSAAPHNSRSSVARTVIGHHNAGSGVIQDSSSSWAILDAAQSGCSFPSLNGVFRPP